MYCSDTSVLQRVAARTTLIVLEAMKMETHIAAARDCTIAALRVQAGDSRQPRSWESASRRCNVVERAG